MHHAVYRLWPLGSKRTAKPEGRGIETTVVDDDAAIIQNSANRAALYSGGWRRHILAQANAREACIVLCSMRRTSDVKQALNYLKDSAPQSSCGPSSQTRPSMSAQAAGSRSKPRLRQIEALLEWMDANLQESPEPSDRHGSAG